MKTGRAKPNYAKLAMRVGIYLLGLFFMAMAIALAVNAQLGVSPLTSLALVISQLSGISLGNCVTFIYMAAVALQALLLRRSFRAIYLLQVPFSLVFGLFVDGVKALLGDFSLPGYAGSLVLLAGSILLFAIGITLYLSVDIISMPMEGLAQAVARVTGFAYHNMKILVDGSCVALAIPISLVAWGNLGGVREGTILTVLLVGKIIGVIQKFINPAVQRLCMPPAAAKTEQAATAGQAVD